jgi:hypothetical protein
MAIMDLRNMWLESYKHTFAPIAPHETDTTIERHNELRSSLGKIHYKFSDIEILP